MWNLAVALHTEVDTVGGQALGYTKPLMIGEHLYIQLTSPMMSNVASNAIPIDIVFSDAMPVVISNAVLIIMSGAMPIVQSHV